MTEAEGDHTPIAPPDTQSTPPGWVMLAEAFPWVAYIVGDPKVAAEEVWRALLAGRVRFLRRRFLNGSVEDVVIHCAVATLANEQGADSLKSQRDVGVLPRFEIIFKQGQLSIPSHDVVRLLSSAWIISREFLEDSQ